MRIKLKEDALEHGISNGYLSWEVRLWLIQNMFCRWDLDYKDGCHLTFKTEADAIMFKLRWS